MALCWWKTWLSAEPKLPFVHLLPTERCENTLTEHGACQISVNVAFFPTQYNITIDLFLHRGEPAFINKFPWTPENPERAEAGISLCYIREQFLKMHTHTHLQKKHAWMYPRAHKHTWLHNNTPYLCCYLKSPFHLLISGSAYACAHAHIVNACMRACACFPPKHSQYANPAWKLDRRRRGASFASTGHVPWQPHPDCQPVRWDMFGTLTQWQRSYWSGDLIKKGGLASLPSLALLMQALSINSPVDTG